MEQKGSFTPSCPAPSRDQSKILLAHGGGGMLMHSLIERLFVSTFDNAQLQMRHDGALIELDGSKLAFTTDSYVVHPLFFPGGDIGTLAINGTVNDLAMCGARPIALSAGFILEEGLAMDVLSRVVRSMKQAADAAHVKLVTGDTKVVNKGKGDELFINTAGVGIVEHNYPIVPQNVKPGEAVLLSGDIGRHGMAIMALREGLAFEGAIESDCAALSDLVLELLGSGIEVCCLRDLTRGGLASALVEISQTAKVHIAIEESAIPVREEVKGACEILGFDPLYVANEGRFVAFVNPEQARKALSILRANPLGSEASVIGRVAEDPAGLVSMTSRIGSSRIVSMLSGEQLPRIC